MRSKEQQEKKEMWEKYPVVHCEVITIQPVPGSDKNIIVELRCIENDGIIKITY